MYSNSQDRSDKDLLNPLKYYDRDYIKPAIIFKDCWFNVYNIVATIITQVAEGSMEVHASLVVVRNLKQRS